jgi:integrase
MSKRKKKEFEPRVVKIRGQAFYQIYLGSRVMERNGRMVRILDRKTYSSREEARTAAELYRIQKLNHGAAALTISSKLRDEAIEAQNLLEPHRISLLDAVRTFVAGLETAKQSRTVEAATRDFLAGLEADGRSARYLGDLRCRLRRFTLGFAGRTLADISTSDVEHWLRSLKVGAVSRNSYRRRLLSLFTYAVDRGWCPNNPITKVGVARERPKPPGILSPEQFAQLLGIAGGATLPYWLLAGFGGIRAAEIARLNWADIHFDAELIEVGSHQSKTAARRFVHMSSNLIAWLAPCQNDSGAICPPNLRKLLEADRARAGLGKWPNNCLRHSYASYHLAYFKNAATLSLEMGHVNPHLVFKHYRELVRPEEAAKWWNIMPENENKIVAIA